MSQPEKRPFRLGDWRIEPKGNRIQAGETTRHLEPRVMDVLVCLAARPGEVVSRDELMETVWSGVVVGEESLTRAISDLRRKLGDDPRSPRFVETIHKSGYRLLVPPCPEPTEGAVAVDEETPQPHSASSGRAGTGPDAEPAAAHPEPAPRRFGAAWGIAAALIIVVAVAWMQFGRRADEPAPGTEGILSAVPLTSYPGAEEFPAISPDGNHVAFAWGGEDGDNVDIYVMQIGSESRLRLTDHPETDTYPRWSPDSRTLVYLHADNTGQALLQVPIIGGQPRELVRPSGWLGGHAFSPDGINLAYTAGSPAGGPAALFVKNLESGESRPVAEQPEHGVGDIAPAWSPDGSTVAFVRIDGAGLQDIYLVPASGGDARRLTHGLLQIRGIDWTRDGGSLIASAVSSAYYALWRIDIRDGSMTRVPTRGEWVHYPSVARDADRLVYQDIWFDKNVWRVQRDEDPALGLSTDALLTSTRWDCEASYSPDGDRVAFTSARSGSLEVWTAAADGSKPLQLTRFETLNVGNPRWSPDGRSVAFHGSEDGLPDLWIADAAGGMSRRLTDGNHNHLLSSWSRDGEWLYYGSDQGGGWELWKLRVDDPTATEEPVTSGGGISGFESADGTSIYYARPDRPGLWRLPLGSEDGPAEGEPFLENLPRQGDWGNWGIADTGIALARRSEEGPSILFYDFALGELQEITRVPNIAVPSVAVSPDGLSFLYARVESRVSDVMLVDGFR